MVKAVKNTKNERVITEFTSQLNKRITYFLGLIKKHGFNDDAEERNKILQRISVEFGAYGFSASRNKKEIPELYSILDEVENICIRITNLIKKGNSSFICVNQVKGQLELLQKELRSIYASV